MSMTTTQNITRKDTNPFSEGHETRLSYRGEKTGTPREKLAYAHVSFRIYVTHPGESAKLNLTSIIKFAS